MIEPYEVSIDNKIQSMEDKINKLEQENIELKSNISKLNSRLRCLENIVGILIFVDILLMCFQFIFK